VSRSKEAKNDMGAEREEAKKVRRIFTNHRWMRDQGEKNTFRQSSYEITAEERKLIVRSGRMR
jgi:hypothetical protein